VVKFHEAARASAVCNMMFSGLFVAAQVQFHDS